MQIIKTGFFLTLIALIAIIFVPQPTIASPSALVWVGNMYPGPADPPSVTSSSHDVYVQVYKGGVTDAAGAGAGITCELYWSAVSAPGVWGTATVTPMTYNTDVGNNDEYSVTISPPAGDYEYTTRCNDTTDGTTMWYGENHDPSNATLTVSGGPPNPGGNGSYTGWRAMWVEEGKIAWNRMGGQTYELHTAANGGLTIPSTAGSGINLTFGGTATASSYSGYPNIGGYDLWSIPAGSIAQVPTILQGEFAIAAYDASGGLIDATGVQIQGVLDDLYTYNGDLGITWSGGTPSVHLWAPTAQSVELLLYADGTTATSTAVAMTRDAATGVWSATGTSAWNGQYYNFLVEVFVPETGDVETNVVTDPYSISLSTNSVRSQMIDLDDPTLKPAGWDTYTKPAYTTPEDITVYEVHVRDFSRDDATVGTADRGKFSAFTYDGVHNPLSDGMNHLKNLQVAGLTHVHLLPVFDIGSVEEDTAAQTNPSYATMATYGPSSDQQQALVAANRVGDAWNWGYDPYHYGAPEGSYSTNPEGSARILEFREMVKVLNANGMRVVMDVVYNHTHSSGQEPTSVLDRIVPGYYHRYDTVGELQVSSCCADTATEFAMMDKLMADTLVRWAVDYKVDGFRFDLMNLHTVDNMVAIRNQVNTLTMAADGVDGNDIYIYGEGWDFGSAKEKGLDVATQFGAAGTGIGTFNDRIRDAIHGGYTTDPDEIRRQGFVNGLSYDWNGFAYGSRDQGSLRYQTDRLRVGLSGSLQNYAFTDQSNATTTGIGLNGTGYTTDPQETVNYASKHDNEALYDLGVYRLPSGTSMADRVRVQNMSLSLIGLSQGIPFFQLGSDMLRSKSLDRNSYDSGDWFNRIDFTYSENNFGVGLPPEWDNDNRWAVMTPLLNDTSLQAGSADINKSVAHLQEMLAIRSSSPLFRLTSAADVSSRLQFHNTGSNQTDGLIVMTISDETGTDIDTLYENVIVLFNADKFAHDFTIGSLAGRNIMLHPIQQSSYDSVVQTASYNASGTFSVPPRTAAVFVESSGITPTPTHTPTPIPTVGGSTPIPATDTPTPTATNTPSPTPSMTPSPTGSTGTPPDTSTPTPTSTQAAPLSVSLQGNGHGQISNSLFILLIVLFVVMMLLLTSYRRLR